MPRTGRRLTIAKNIYRDSGGYEIRVMIGGETYTARLLPDATLKECRAKLGELQTQGQTDSPRAERGTLRVDGPRYLKLIAHLLTWKDRAHHLAAWIALYGDVPRYRLTESDVLTARARWLADGLAPKTINHRADTLRNLFHRLDGRHAPTPCDNVPHLAIPKTIIQRVSEKDILGVDAKLQAREQNKQLQFDGAKTRARFRVFVSTGKRPCEIMRTQPADIDLKARVWVPRDAKGGYCPGVYLNNDQLAAWKLFIKADAWGKYNHGNFGRVIREAGWPDNVRPYQARHSTWIAAVERGAPLEDVATGAGHRDMRLTQRVYTGIRNSRLQRLSETLEGRFQKWPVLKIVGPVSGSGQKAKKRSRK